MPFQPGTSGNLQGRPKGTGYRQQLFNDLVMPHKEALLEKAISMAKDGDAQMLKLLLDRILPAKPVDEPIAFEMPKKLNSYRPMIDVAMQILHAMAKTEVTPEEGKKLLKIFASFREI